MSTGTNLEIERKYLIRYPDAALLARQPGTEVWQIVQTYLTDGPGFQTRRVRKIVSDGRTRYFRTFKSHVSALASLEDEAEISANEYERYINEADCMRQPILKTRYRIPHAGHILEVDIYPFWKDRAVLEIELDAEDEDADIPDYLNIIRDVTGEREYKNSQLARYIPMEEI